MIATAHDAEIASLNRRPSLVAKASVGLTGIMESTQWQIYEIFLIFYYAQVLGLAGGLAGLAVAIAMVVDAFVDPLIGNYSDSFRGRFGRRHSLMFAAILPTGLFLYFLFSPPRGLGEVGLFGWLLALCLAVRITSSFFSVPAGAVAAELTDDPVQRAELGIWRQATVALLQVGLMALLVAFALTPTPAMPDGRLNPDSYPKLGAIVAAVLVLTSLLGALGTRRPIREFEQHRLLTPARRLSIGASLRLTWQALVDLPNFRALFLGLLFAGIMGSYFRALNLHLATYFWELTTAQTGAWLTSTQIAMFATALLCRFLVTRFEVKTLYLTGIVIMLVAYVLPPALRLVDWMPANGSTALVAVLYAANTLVGCGNGLIMACSLVLFAETADEYAFVKGESRTGMVLAFLPLGNKLASSFGKVLAGLLIEWIAFPVGRPAASIPAEPVWSLGVATVCITLVAGLVALYFYSGYRLSRARYAEIRQGQTS